jgi:hypothetical protein
LWFCLHKMTLSYPDKLRLRWGPSWGCRVSGSGSRMGQEFCTQVQGHAGKCIWHQGQDFTWKN